MLIRLILQTSNHVTYVQLENSIQLRINRRGAVIPHTFFFRSVINSYFIIQSLRLICWPRYSLSLRTAVTVTTTARHCPHQLASSIYCTFPRTVSLRYITFLTSSKEFLLDGINVRRAFAAMGLLAETCGDFFFPVAIPSRVRIFERISVVHDSHTYGAKSESRAKETQKRRFRRRC